MEQNTTSYPAEWIDLQEQLSAIGMSEIRAADLELDDGA